MTEHDDLALRATGLGKRYRRGWALQDCDLALPRGTVAALVGPNGAGKSTLLHLATGLLRPTTGHVEVLGRPMPRAGIDPKLAFLAQDKPLYRGFTVEGMLRAGAALNTSWDAGYAAQLVDRGHLPRAAKVATLSGGQRSRLALALALALARRPELLLLDEPLADLDPLVRREVMAELMGAVAETGMTVLLSSHVLTDLDDTCDHLVILARGRVQLAGDIDTLLAGHRVLTGPAHQAIGHIPSEVIVGIETTTRQATVLINDPALLPGPDWISQPATVDDLVLAHLRTAAEQDAGDRAVLGQSA